MSRYHIHRMIAPVALVIVGFFLAACQTTPNAPPPKIFSDEAFRPLPLNARRLEIIDNWQMPMKGSFVGHRASPLPTDVVGQWASTVLQPAGGSGEIVLDLKRASVTMLDLPLKQGLDGLFVDQQSHRVTAEIDAHLMWLQPVGGTHARIELRATHAVTIAESSTPGVVLGAIHESLQGAIKRLDRQARQELGKVDRLVLP